MKRVRLGDLTLPAIGLGLSQFGSPSRGWGEMPPERATAIVQRALDLGINLFDTAELYGFGRSERTLAVALSGRRGETLVASKVSPHHLTRRGVWDAAQRSLSRLATDHLDLYQVHWPNRFIPAAATMAGMRDLLDAGKVRNVGVSNFKLDRWRRAEQALGRPIVTNQVQFSLLDLRPLDDLVPYAQANGRAIIAYSPLALGALGGRYGPSLLPGDFRAGSPLFSDAGFRRIAPLLQAVDDVALAHGATRPQIALAWLLHIPNVIAIPGARSLEQVESNAAAAADIVITGAEWQRLTDVARGLPPPARRRGPRPFVEWLLGA